MAGTGLAGCCCGGVFVLASLYQQLGFVLYICCRGAAAGGDTVAAPLSGQPEPLPRAFGRADVFGVYRQNGGRGAVCAVFYFQQSGFGAHCRGLCGRTNPAEKG